MPDGDISWTMTSSGHFLKWANFRGHLQRVTHFLVNSSGDFYPREVPFWVNFCEHFLGEF